MPGFRAQLHYLSEMLISLHSALDTVLLLSVAYSSAHLRSLVEELPDLQELVIANLTRWSTPDSAFEAAIGMIEQIRRKQGILRNHDG